MDFKELSNRGKGLKERLEQLEQYKTKCEGVPNVIAVLGRGLEFTEDAEGNTRAKTTGYLGKEVHGNVSGSLAGVYATAELAKYFPDARIMTNSYVEKTGEQHAEVIAAELHHLGVGADRIIIQKESFSTYSELLELIRLIAKHKLEHAVVVVNEFVVRRARAFLAHIHDVGDRAGYRERPGIAEALREYEELRRNGKARITVVSSEEIISLINPWFRGVVEAARKLPEWQETLRIEESGADAIEKGEYGKNPPATSVKQ